MNKLPGRLLYACFEQGPFQDQELKEACLAWPQLARFWLGKSSPDRVWGLANFPIKPDEDMVLNSGGTSYLFNPRVPFQLTGLSWYFDESRGFAVLLVNLVDQNEILCELCISREGHPEPEHGKDLESALNWMAQDPECEINGEYSIQQDCFVTTPWIRLSQFLAKPLLPEELTLARLVYILQVYKKTTLVNMPLFEALAKVAFENQPHVPRKRKHE